MLLGISNTLSCAGFLLACATLAESTQLVLPQGRQAYYADEPIEIAIAGLPKDSSVTLELVPQKDSLSKIEERVKGDGSTMVFVVPAATLTPDNYVVKLNGQDAGSLIISSGVTDSTLLVSQTIGWDQLKEAGANFNVGNAFSFGRFTPDGAGPLTTKLRESQSTGLSIFDRAIAANLPTLVYMYWTGYVTHKPFGTQKSWVNEEMIQAMRLLSFHTAQRLRRFHRNIISVGTLDEPGLSWGETPTGGWASGFPNWDEAHWYQGRGWEYTNAPAARDDADWVKYLTIRCAILKECNEQAKNDLKAIWPELVFSTDLYAPHAIMDGTDPLNQQVNDIPSSHIFVDWGIDRLGAYSGAMLEKSHNPTSKLAHAMNGQLFGERVPQPGQLNAYRVTLNGLLAAGLESNWWLNTGGMTSDELAMVNNPAKRVGPILHETSLTGHDAAVLWSFTEAAMRQKEMAAKEAKKKTGEGIKLMVSSLPENTSLQGKEIDINAYNIGGDYKETVLTAHYALSRAGYPAHIIHERLLPEGILKDYKTLVIVGQTFALPANIMPAIGEFIEAGGKIVVDQSTTVNFENAISVPINLTGLSYRWSVLFTQDAKSFKTAKEASYFQTNHFMDESVRQAVMPFKMAMKQMASQPRLETESNELLVECHVAGEGFLTVVINGYGELPDINDDEKYWIYNYAPYGAEYKLMSLPTDCVVYVMEGADWSKTGKLANPQSTITGKFEPGEMKLYLISPREPVGLDVSATLSEGILTISASLKNLKMPWPITITIKEPSGATLYEVYRATKANGTYQESFPIGTNAPAGIYNINIISPLASLSGQTQVNYTDAPATLQDITDKVRVFDGRVIQSFFADQPEIIIAIGSDNHKTIANRLADSLSESGLEVTVKAESQALRKVHYPRVWNPYARVYQATGDEQSLKGRTIESHITLATDFVSREGIHPLETETTDGNVTATSMDGSDVADWRQPNSLVTIAKEGYVDYIADVETCYEPGVILYFDEERNMTVIKGELKEEPTTDEFKAKWSKPWTKLTTHVGGYQFPPQLPEAYTTDNHLILLGDNTSSQAVGILQASDLLLQVVDSSYPGEGKALISFVWSPFAVGKNVILVGATDEIGLNAGVNKLIDLALVY